MQASTAETHRISAISHIESALHNEEFTEEQRIRLLRLVRMLEESENLSSERKLVTLEDNVIPALISMGLVTPQEDIPPK